MLAAGCDLSGGPCLTPVETLTTLLTAEGLAFVALIFALDHLFPDDGKNRNWLVPPRYLGYGAAAALVAMAIGAFSAWRQVYAGPEPSNGTETVIAIALVVAIVAPALLGVLMALSLRRSK